MRSSPEQFRSNSGAPVAEGAGAARIVDLPIA
jgi:hypothetical protein